MLDGLVRAVVAANFKVDVVILSFNTTSDWCAFLMPQIEIEIPASDCDKEYGRYINWRYSMEM